MQVLKMTGKMQWAGKDGGRKDLGADEQNSEKTQN